MSALAVAARGISAVIKNEGSMKLIVGSRLQKSDVEAIREGKENPERIISKMMLRALEEIDGIKIPRKRKNCIRRIFFTKPKEPTCTLRSLKCFKVE